MSIRKTIIIAGFIFLFAIFAGAAADNSCLDCHVKAYCFQ